MASSFYTLTQTAEDDFKKAKQWSNARWGKKLTQEYFKDLHKAAEHAAKNQTSIARKAHLTSIEGLDITVVREHYLVYVPSNDNHIIIVALLRQTQNVSSILKANSFIIQRSVKGALESIEKDP